MWLPEGTNINETDRMASSLADYIRGHEETEMVSTYIGRTPPPLLFIQCIFRSSIQLCTNTGKMQDLQRFKGITCATARLHSPEISRTPDKSEQIRA